LHWLTQEVKESAADIFAFRGLAEIANRVGNSKKDRPSNTNPNPFEEIHAFYLPNCFSIPAILPILLNPLFSELYVFAV
jgi:hypothetical protein